MKSHFLQIVTYISHSVLLKLRCEQDVGRLNRPKLTAIRLQLSTELTIECPAYGRTKTQRPGCPRVHANILLSPVFICFNPNLRL